MTSVTTGMSGILNTQINTFSMLKNTELNHDVNLVYISSISKESLSVVVKPLSLMNKESLLNCNEIANGRCISTIEVINSIGLFGAHKDFVTDIALDSVELFIDSQGSLLNLGTIKFAWKYDEDRYSVLVDSYKCFVDQAIQFAKGSTSQQSKNTNVEKPKIKPKSKISAKAGVKAEKDVEKSQQGCRTSCVIS